MTVPGGPVCTLGSGATRASFRPTYRRPRSCVHGTHTRSCEQARARLRRGVARACCGGARRRVPGRRAGRRGAGVTKVVRARERRAAGRTGGTPPIGTYSHHPVVIRLPARPDSYLGAYTRGVPAQLRAAAGGGRRHRDVAPADLALYYSGWFERFRTAFATAAARARRGANGPDGAGRVSLAAIAAGKYDAYLSQFAVQVKADHHPVILSFGHEMNGYWYPWGNGHTSPAAFVAAWRHMVTLFRDLGARNVTWLWTVNIIDSRHNRIPSPRPWWPGSSYVNWVGSTATTRNRAMRSLRCSGRPSTCASSPTTRSSSPRPARRLRGPASEDH